VFINKGILVEDKLQGKELKEIQRCCVFLYTTESFLYQLVNSTLRTDDCSKIDTLGAYCYLLWYYLYTGDERKRTLYRVTTLTNINRPKEPMSHGWHLLQRQKIVK
jgi:hypothetical protein